jgi:NADH-quinone oxidoreductase subunit E
MENLGEKSLKEAKKFEKVYEILALFSYNSNKLISILHAIQEEYNYLPEEILIIVASSLKISPAQVFGVVTFYPYFTLKPKGKYIIKVCDGTACHIKNSDTIIKALHSKLNVTENKSTTDNLLFTLETVPCLGACGIAPAMVINEEVYPEMTPEKIILEIDKIYNKENANEGLA